MLALIISVILISYTSFNNVDKGYSVSLSIINVFSNIKIITNLTSETINSINSILKIGLLASYFNSDKKDIKYYF